METMTIDEVSELWADDCYKRVTVAESGPVLNDEYSRDEWYTETYGSFWGKVGEIADILKKSIEWPFEPLEVSRDRKVLFDGHHRSNAALLVGWDKPIPVDSW